MFAQLGRVAHQEFRRAGPWSRGGKLELPVRSAARVEKPMRQRKTDAKSRRPHTAHHPPDVLASDEYIHGLVGSCKNEDSLVEAREREHRQDDRAKDRKLNARSRELKAQRARS